MDFAWDRQERSCHGQRWPASPSMRRRRASAMSTAPQARSELLGQLTARDPRLVQRGAVAEGNRVVLIAGGLP